MEGGVTCQQTFLRLTLFDSPPSSTPLCAEPRLLIINLDPTFFWCWQQRPGRFGFRATAKFPFILPFEKGEIRYTLFLIPPGITPL